MTSVNGKSLYAHLSDLPKDILIKMITDSLNTYPPDATVMHSRFNVYDGKELKTYVTHVCGRCKSDLSLKYDDSKPCPDRYAHWKRDADAAFCDKCNILICRPCNYYKWDGGYHISLCQECAYSNGFRRCADCNDKWGEWPCSDCGKCLCWVCSNYGAADWLCKECKLPDSMSKMCQI